MRCLYDPINLAKIIASFASSPTTSQIAKNGTEKLYYPLGELQGSNSEFELITPKLITGSYFENNLYRFSWVGLSMVAILDF